MVDQPTSGIPVYVVKSIAGGRPRVLHRNLLLPLQGRLRQEGATGEGSNPDSDSEGETPEPPQVPCGRPRRARHVNPTKKRDAPSIPRLPTPEPGDGDSREDEEYVTLSTPADTPASIQEEVVQSTIDEPDTDPSDLSSDVQTLPDHAPSEHESEPDNGSESDSDSSAPIIPRRSARSTKGIPPVCYGQVQIKSTIISDYNKPTRYRQVLYVPCFQ